MALWKEGEPVSTAEVPETSIGKGCEMEGTIVVHGNLRIDGKVKGHVQVDGTLVIGPGAQVLADVTSDVLRVEGEVTGELKATGLISLQPSARVKGSLEAPSLAIERGAHFEGTCKMDGKKPHVAPAPQPVATPAPAPRPEQRPQARPA